MTKHLYRKIELLWNGVKLRCGVKQPGDEKIEEFALKKKLIIQLLYLETV